MKATVFGAGAIGGMLGAALIEGGAETTLIARGPHLEALRAKGLRLVTPAGERTFTVRATADTTEVGPQDVVIVATKAQGAAVAVDALAPMLGRGTAVVTAINGVPWWYFHGIEGPLAGRRLETVDPGGRQWDVIGPRRAIGCVVYPAAEVVAPGAVRVLAGDRFVLGEPDGTMSERAGALARVLVKGGLRVPVRPDIRTEIWVKLWGNVAFNPISALTRSTMAALVEDPATRALIHAVMAEAEQVANALGVVMPIALQARLEGARKVGEHRTSMLQDLERGRPMEIDALVAAVAELGRLAGVATPTIDVTYALVRRLAIETGCYRA
jgi:2-dehydropantoate 2-reductase